MQYTVPTYVISCLCSLLLYVFVGCCCCFFSLFHVNFFVSAIIFTTALSRQLSKM